MNWGLQIIRIFMQSESDVAVFSYSSVIPSTLSSPWSSRSPWPSRRRQKGRGGGIGKGGWRSVLVIHIILTSYRCQIRCIKLFTLPEGEARQTCSEGKVSNVSSSPALTGHCAPGAFIPATVAAAAAESTGALLYHTPGSYNGSSIHFTH